MNAKALNSKETKEIVRWLEAQFDAKLDLDYYFFEHENNKIYMANKEITNIQLEKLRIDSVGLYFCRRMPDGFRLTIEGSQIIGKSAKKNVVNLSVEEMNNWLKGQDIDVKGDYKGYVIMRCNNDFLGSGKFKEGRILNYVPKTRRLNTVAD
jgi:NOL1/NOP2/fmu family ribosome biogenesis protein